MKGQKTGGRQKGTLNKSTRDIKRFTTDFLSSKEYVESAKARVIAGTAPHLETLWHQYAFGKPRDVVQVEGGIPPFVLKLENGFDH